MRGLFPVHHSRWVNLLFAITLMITLYALVLGCYSWSLLDDLDEVKMKEAKESVSPWVFTDCPVMVTICEPEYGQHVGAEFDVSGRCSYDCRCRNLFVLFKSHPGDWVVKRQLPVDTDGRWKGRIRIDELPVGMSGEIQVRITRNEAAYTVGEELKKEGITLKQSDSIKIVRRSEHEKLSSAGR